MAEIEAATAAAARLMRKHNISEAQMRRAQAKAQQKFEKRFVGRMDSRWNSNLAYWLGKYNFCEAVLTRGKDPTRPDIILFGQKDNLDIVEYMYKFLLREIRQLATRAWNAQEQHELTRGKFDRAFGLGAVQAIAQRLQAEQDAMEREEEQSNAAEAADSKALLVITGRELATAFEEAYPNLKKASKTPTADQNAMVMGYLEGLAIQMRKGIGEGK